MKFLFYSITTTCQRSRVRGINLVNVLSQPQQRHSWVISWSLKAERKQAVKPSCFTSPSQTGSGPEQGEEVRRRRREDEDVAPGAVGLQFTDKCDLVTIWLLRRWQHLEDGLKVPQKCCQESN